MLVSRYAAVNDELSIAGMDLEFLPEEVFIGNAAIERLNKTVVLLASNNRLHDLPVSISGVTEQSLLHQERSRAAVSGLLPQASLAHTKGDLLYHCNQLQVCTTCSDHAADVDRFHAPPPTAETGLVSKPAQVTAGK